MHRSVLIVLVLLLAACGGTNNSSQSSNNGASFSVEISGSHTGTLNQNNATATYTITEMEDNSLLYQVWFGNGEDLTAFVILGIEPEAETYTIDKNSFFQGDEATGTVIINVDDLTAMNGDGSITYTSVGNKVSGEFEFTASPFDDPDYLVTVKASFEDVPVTEVSMKDDE